MLGMTHGLVPQWCREPVPLFNNSCRSLRPVTGINPADPTPPFAQSSEMVG